MARLKLALLVLAGALLAGCGSTHGTASQGLVVQTKDAVLLVDLHGRVQRTLPGYKLAPNTNDLLLDAIVQQSIGGTYGDSGYPVLLGPRGRVWQVIDGELRPEAANRIVLPGNAVVEGRVVGHRSDHSAIFGVTIRDATTKRLLAPAKSHDWFVTPASLLATPHVVTDLVTRERWRLKAGTTWRQGVGQSACNPAGIAHDEVVAVCQYLGKFAHGFNSIVRVFAVRHDGTRELLGKPFPYANFGAMTAVLSPDGAHVAATLAVGCGLSPSMIAPTAGGTPRYVDGTTAEHAGAHTQSYVLGWTSSNELVAEFQHGECEKVSPPAVYLVDPETFERTRVYVLPPGTQGFTMWSRPS